MMSILKAFHSSLVGGHHGETCISYKILKYGYYWVTIYKDAHNYAAVCDQCLRRGTITRRYELSMTPIFQVELFDVWGIDFMGPFISLCGIKYIHVAVDYVSKWVEAIALPNNETHMSLHS